MCTPTQGVWQPAGCVSCELVCVCVSFVRVVIICLASTHTALVSGPSLAVLHLSTYLLLLEVLEVDFLWPRWVARIGVTRATEACFLTADRQSVHGVAPSPTFYPTFYLYLRDQRGGGREPKRRRREERRARTQVQRELPIRTTLGTGQARAGTTGLVQETIQAGLPSACRGERERDCCFCVVRMHAESTLSPVQH